MYAVIRSGGKQARVAPGDFLRVEKLEGDVGEEAVADVAVERTGFPRGVDFDAFRFDRTVTGTAILAGAGLSRLGAGGSSGEPDGRAGCNVDGSGEKIRGVDAFAFEGVGKQCRSIGLFGHRRRG